MDDEDDPEDRYREYAREELASDELTINEDAEVILGDYGAWVQSWTYVHDGDIESLTDEEDEDGPMQDDSEVAGDAGGDGRETAAPGT